MNDDLETNESTEIKELDLNYTIYSDDEEKAVYLKFEKFEDTDQIKSFIEFIDQSLPLLLFQSETKH